MDDKIVLSVADAGADSQWVEEASLTLRRELLELDVEDVEQVRDGEAPAGTRAFDPALVGTLLVTLSSSANALAGVVSTVRGWLSRGSPSRTVELSIGDKKLTLSAASDEQQERLIREFLKSSSQD